MSALKFGTNLSSLRAQRRLAEGTTHLSKTFERLSSGQRINRAADDAAGLAISESLKSDTRVFNQGIRNYNDGLSMLSIADSALESLSPIVVRLKELAEQAANGTYSSIQRDALNSEAQALSKEYTRIVHSTKFNGVHLLDGSLGEGVRLQGGYGEMGGIFSGIGGAIGDGTLGLSARLTSGVNPADLVTGDFDGDGHMDIVSADSGWISLYRGYGDGSFAARVSYQIGLGPNAIKAADFNGDGVLDIVTADNGSNSVSVFLGTGNGTFQARQSFSAGPFPYDVAVGDFNGDGIADVATSHSGSRVSILLGNGDGTFRERTSFATGNTPWGIDAGDINGDGILDLVTANYADDTLSVLIGRGDGTFSGPTAYSIGDQPYDVQIGDLNGDGVMDLISADYNDKAISVLIGRGDGTFASRVSYDMVSGVGGGPMAVKMGDLNGDGLLDVIAAEYPSQVNIFLGNGDGTLRAGSFNELGSTDFTSALALSDFNEDGVVDVATADSWVSRVSVFLGNAVDGASPLLPFSLTTLADARQALPVFDQKIQQLALQRGTIGSFQSRLNVGINTLQAGVENYSAAESRIRDADIAQESSELARYNILQQAAAAVLAQANLQPQLALTLLSNRD